MKLRTISESYIQLNRELHEKNFGGAGHKRLPDILPVIQRIRAETILDYGAGQGLLKVELDRLNTSGEIGIRQVVNYDPAVDAYNQKPDGWFDLVVCTDVLEHIEPEYLDNVLVEIYQYTRKALVALIAFGPSGKFLSDGRNAHLIQESPNWWEEKIFDFGWARISADYRYYPGRDEIKKALYVLEKDCG